VNEDELIPQTPLGNTGVLLAEAALTQAVVATKPGAPTTKLTYNRNHALHYARKYWNRVCHDLYIAGVFDGEKNRNFTRVPRDTRFVHVTAASDKDPDSEYARTPDGSRTVLWKPMDDCTHFISCCIGRSDGEESGGLPIKSDFAGPPNAPYGIVGAERLVHYLTEDRGWAAVLGRQTTDTRLPAEMQPGDLIAYFDADMNRHVHLVLYLGNDKICCHTYARSDDTSCTWDNTWLLTEHQAGWKKTFLHFVV
jgi:hypothetical protein